MFVKNRDDRPNTVSYCARRTRGIFDRAFREHKRRMGLPSPVFLTVAGGPC